MQAIPQLPSSVTVAQDTPGYIPPTTVVSIDAKSSTVSNSTSYAAQTKSAIETPGYAPPSTPAASFLSSLFGAATTPQYMPLPQSNQETPGYIPPTPAVPVDIKQEDTSHQIHPAESQKSVSAANSSLPPPPPLSSYVWSPLVQGLLPVSILMMLIA